VDVRFPRLVSLVYLNTELVDRGGFCTNVHDNKRNSWRLHDRACTMC